MVIFIILSLFCYCINRRPLYNKYMPTMRRWIKVLLLAVLFLGVTQTSYAEQRIRPEDARFFADSRKVVSGAVLAFYDSLDDPLLVLGNPYSQEFYDPTTGYVVQYFDKAPFSSKEKTGL